MRPLRPTDPSHYLAIGEYMRRVVQGLPGVEGIGRGLAPYELKVFSQNGEDGVLAEILRRAGIVRSGFFVEFGAEDGVEINCGALADLLGWHGAFLEGDPARHHYLHRKYAPNERIATGNALVTPETVNELFALLQVPSEFDVLSIDIDSDDYWVWKALDGYSAKVVIVEVNLHIPPTEALTQAVGDGPWQGTDFYGASLGAFRQLGLQKGYRLVHVDLTGNNAFFVRNDVPGQYDELTAVNGPNHFLLGGGHPPDETGRQYVAAE